MESNIKYKIAMAELLYYLKGIRKEDIAKIPQKLMVFFLENASKDYKCKFDYNKPLNQLELQEETKGLIAMICLNYWCETNEQKKNFIRNLNKNERKYQEQLREKYSPDNIFKNQTINTIPIQEKTYNNETSMIEYKESFFTKIMNWFKSLFCKK